ncbi:MAG: butyryl-CoA dehydrogenase [Actinomycetota bacterium]|nr:butyryl-CoA dehydrogenase [Actinomycetota bacterium]
MTAAPFLDVLEELIATVIEPSAAAVDATGQFPRAAVTALGEKGLLGLTSSADVGGMGLGLGEAAQVVRRLAASCGSTAMVLCMHYSAAAVIEQRGPEDVRRAIADGVHLSTLALSETGSRSHFWVPLGTARPDGDDVVLDSSKSWITSAGEADSYVWTSRPMLGDVGASLWLVPANAGGLKVGAPFDGLGLRGNASSSVKAVGVRVPAAALLGSDGAGLDIALTVALPVFQILSASCSIGLMDAAVARTIQHVSTARLEHLDQTLSQQPVVRQHIADMKNQADAASVLVDDAIVALTTGRDGAALRMLQAKTVAGDTAISVIDMAMRVGGGAAFRKDLAIERHFRDSRATVVMAPTSDTLRDLIGRAISGQSLFE